MISPTHTRQSPSLVAPVARTSAAPAGAATDPSERTREAANAADGMDASRPLQRTPSPQYDRPYRIQHALPQACQPRYQAEFIRPVLTEGDTQSTARQLTYWQHTQQAAQTLLSAVTAPLQPALGLLQPAAVIDDDDPDGLFALRRDYAAARRIDADTCAVDSDDASDDDATVSKIA